MRFNHITLDISDLERSKEFYRSLGLIQIVDTPPRYARFTFPEGDATLSVEVTEAGGQADPQKRATLFFECDALDDTVAALKLKGLVFDQDPTDMFYLWREAWLRDPDGHAIRLYSAGDNRLNPPWRMMEGV
ncbi:MAG: VOC family protein [Chloroflexota bacterium]|nr:VOC family protein [Chloroflexota bacterium]